MSAPQPVDMEAAILGFVRSHFGGTDIDVLTPLFTSGTIDSFGVLELIAFLEETFGVQIDPSVHELHQFDTIAKCAALVASRQRPQA